MSGFYMRVLASDHVFYQGRVEAVTLPGDDGERTVLAHHADSIISIREGELRFRDVEENWHEAIVGLGFAEMINNRLTILVDTAERPEDIDRKRAEEAKARAEEQLRQKVLNSYKYCIDEYGTPPGRITFRGVFFLPGIRQKGPVNLF